MLPCENYYTQRAQQLKRQFDMAQSAYDNAQPPEYDTCCEEYPECDCAEMAAAYQDEKADAAYEAQKDRRMGL